MTVEELESEIEAIRNRPLVLLCRAPDGQEHKMSLRECITTGSAFIHVAGRNDLDDLDALLAVHLESVEGDQQPKL